MPPRIFRVIVPVDGIERAVPFYQTLLALEGEKVSQDRYYFDCGIVLALVNPSGDRSPFRPNPEWFYFSVDDLDATLARAQVAGATIETPIRSYPWGERSFYIWDPFGNPLCFVDGSTLFTGGRFVP